MEEKNCAYCDEEEGTEKIVNPNLNLSDEIDWKSDDNWWIVCKDCKNTIRLQQIQSIAVQIKDETLLESTNEKLKQLVKKTGRPVMMIEISKNKDGSGYETSSIEFTNKDDDNNKKRCVI